MTTLRFPIPIKSNLQYSTSSWKPYYAWKFAAIHSQVIVCEVIVCEVIVCEVIVCEVIVSEVIVCEVIVCEVSLWGYSLWGYSFVQYAWLVSIAVPMSTLYCQSSITISTMLSLTAWYPQTLYKSLMN